ncbi:antiterminator Q family protein [Sodalis sp. dw_96]|uniref:antiterminator Q family protein n=1 Tax=Sodalis sp. dw_96 TaxID=2719794 RepID=UPI001BD69640|nr:antiterminator Q family protein [Sodalis sp. dw_96]
MRDIQQVLERWGGWAASDNSGLDWSPIAAGFKGLMPYRTSQRLKCCDSDGLTIDACVLHLQSLRQSRELDLIMLYYVYRMSKREIARHWRIDEKIIRIQLQVAEGFVAGCLAMLDVKLDMDPEVKSYEKEKVSAVRKTHASMF